MSFLERIQQALRSGPAPPPAVQLSPDLYPILEVLARREHKTVNAVVNELLHIAVAERQTAVSYLYIWEALTPRERQTAALACLGYTNSEIAGQMMITTNTVKTHMRNVLNKFSIKSKSELRTVLAGWDFREWVAGQDLQAEPPAPPTLTGSPNGVTP